MKDKSRSRRKINQLPPLQPTSDHWITENWSTLSHVWKYLDPKGKVVAKALILDEMNAAEIADYTKYFMALCGISFIAPGVWLVVAGRDPLRHITWVKFAVLWSILAVVAGLYSIVQGVVNFNQAGTGIILDAVFAVAFLVLYPYRAVRGT